MVLFIVLRSNVDAKKLLRPSIVLAVILNVILHTLLIKSSCTLSC